MIPDSYTGVLSGRVLSGTPTDRGEYLTRGTTLALVVLRNDFYLWYNN